MAGPKTRGGSKVKVEKTAEEMGNIPAKIEVSGHNEMSAHAAVAVGSKRVLRSDTKNNAMKAEPEEEVASSALSRSPPSIPFITRPRMISRLSGAKKVVGTPVSGKPTTFHSFGKLPPELRTKIWKYAIPGPRVVQVKAKIVLSKYSSHIRGMHYDSSTPVPAMLHACHESRVVALLYYELGMSSHLSGPRMYVDFTKDTIYFGESNLNRHLTLSSIIRDMPEREISKIRYLAMSQILWNYKVREHDAVAIEVANEMFKPFCNNHVLMDFRSLKCITLVMEREKASTHKNVIFTKPKEDDHTMVQFFDPELDDDDDEGFVWPCEMEAVLFEQLLDCFGDKERDVPELKLRMLVGNDKPARKGKAKGKVAGK